MLTLKWTAFFIRNGFHQTKWLPLKGKAPTKMISFHWFSLSFTVFFYCQEDNYKLPFCYTKIFIKDNNIIFFFLPECSKTSLYFLCLVQIIDKKPMLRTNFHVFDKVHYDKVFYNFLVWSLKIAESTSKINS